MLWNLVYLAGNPQWKAKAVEEVTMVASKYSADEKLSLVEELSARPLAAWESEFPFIEMVQN